MTNAIQFIGQYDPGKVAYTFKPSAWKLKAGESEVQSYCQPYSKFKTSLGYRRPCLKTQRSLEQLLTDVLENKNFITILKIEMMDNCVTVTHLEKKF